jgi:polyisoprenoid-binding protein YceI
VSHGFDPHGAGNVTKRTDKLCRAIAGSELTIDAATIETGNARRDKHLRSAEFFDVEHHPHVRFTSTSARVDGEHLKAQGHLEAGGERIPLEVEAALRSVDGELEIEAVADADQRRLGMTFSPLGTVRAPTKLVVHGRLVAT